MRRALLIGLPVLVVLVVGFLLARFLSTENAERAAVLRALPERDVQVLRVDSTTAYSLGDTTGPTRIAFRAGGTTVVRCATVRRTGSVLSGRRVSILRVSRPIGLQSSCPR